MSDRAPGGIVAADRAEGRARGGPGAGAARPRPDRTAAGTLVEPGRARSGRSTAPSSTSEAAAGCPGWCSPGAGRPRPVSCSTRSDAAASSCRGAVARLGLGARSGGGLRARRDPWPGPMRSGHGSTWWSPGASGRPRRPPNAPSGSSGWAARSWSRNRRRRRRRRRGGTRRECRDWASVRSIAIRQGDDRRDPDRRSSGGPDDRWPRRDGVPGKAPALVTARLLFHVEQSRLHVETFSMFHVEHP